MINVFIFNSLSYLDHGETKITSDNMSRRISRVIAWTSDKETDR